MPCLNCYSPDKPILARGLCQACYHRLRKNGTVARKNAVNKHQHCSAEGCVRQAWAKGLCSKHYFQSEHPLKGVWRTMRSRVGEGEYPATWDSFEGFLADVGERPSAKHQLRRRDGGFPFSKENSHWVAPISGEPTTGWSKEDRSEYSRNWTLKSRFGLEPEDYDKMAAAQNYVCAICKRPEVQINAKTGTVQRLSVDHDHLSGAVRGLLCFRCNALLGAVDDDTEILLAAADYLDRSRTRTQEVPE